MGSKDKAFMVSLEEAKAALSKFKDLFEMEGTYLSIITPKRYEDVKTVIKNYFLPNEPLNTAFEIEFDDIIDERLNNCLPVNLSLMMVHKETEEIMGVLVNHFIKKSETNKRLENTPHSYLSEFLSMKDKDIDFFDRYKENEAVFFRKLAVDKKYRRLGVGGKLVSAAMQLAKDLGFKVIKTEASSNYSQKIFEKHGFETLAELPYDTYIWKGEPIRVRTREHSKTVIYGKSL